MDPEYSQLHFHWNQIGYLIVDLWINGRSHNLLEREKHQEAQVFQDHLFLIKLSFKNKKKQITEICFYFLILVN